MQEDCPLRNKDSKSKRSHKPSLSLDRSQSHSEEEIEYKRESSLAGRRNFKINEDPENNDSESPIDHSKRHKNRLMSSSRESFKKNPICQAEEKAALSTKSLPSQS